jgi:hypothetical protein
MKGKPDGDGLGRCPSASRASLKPPMSFAVAIHAARLKAGQKAILWSLLTLSDWNTGAGIQASVLEIGRGAGLSRAATSSGLKRLGQRGAVVFERQSKGGYATRRVHRLRLDLRAIQGLHRENHKNPSHPDSGWGSPPESGWHPAQNVHQTVPILNGTPPDSGDNQNSPEGNSEPEAQTRGGGAGASRSREEERERALDPEQMAAASAMISFGVMANRARSLAMEFTPELVMAGIRWAEKHATTAKSPAAVLVSALRDGTVAAALRREQEDDEEARIRIDEMRKRALTAERASRYASLRRTTLEHGEAKYREHAAKQWSAIDAVWRTAEDLALSGAVHDDDLLNRGADPWAVLRKLQEAASIRAAEVRSAALGLPDIPASDGAAGA